MDVPDFSPRMPEVEPLPDGFVEFAWGMAENTARGELVIITPGRNIITSGELPPKDRLTSQQLDYLSQIAPLNQSWRIVAIGLTDLETFQIDAYQAVPILGVLEALVQIGHRVLLFEGHASALTSLCRSADLLIVEAGMLPYMHSDWERVARSELRKPNVLRINMR